MRTFSKVALAALCAFAFLLGLAGLPAFAQSKSDVLETDVLELLFNGAAIADLAENDSTSPATDLYVSLHSASPGEAGDQSTSECAYTGYARVAVARNGTGWSISGNSVSPGSDVIFPAATGGSCTVTDFCIGTAATGSGYNMYCGGLSPSFAVSNGITPRLTTATTVTED